MKDIIEYNRIPLVSTDFNHNPSSAIYDSNLTKVMSEKLLRFMFGMTMNGVFQIGCLM